MARASVPGGVSSRVLRCEDVLIGGFVFVLSLAFAPGLDDPFSLPKLLVLRLFAVVLFLLWSLRTFLEAELAMSLAVPRSVLWPTTLFGVWAIACSGLAVDRYTAFHGNHARYNGFWTYFLYLGIFLAISSSPVDRQRLIRLARFLVVALIPVALYAVVQRLGWDLFQWTAVEGRSGSSIGHPVPLATLMSIGAMLALGVLSEAASRSVRALAGGGLLLFGLALVSSLSRGPLLAFAFALLVWLWGQVRSGALPRRDLLRSRVMRWSAVALLVGTGLGVAVIGPGQMIDRLGSIGEIRSRLLFYSVAGRIVADHPLTGVGFENYRVVYPLYRNGEQDVVGPDVLPTMVHNEYLQVATELGFPGLLLLVWLYFAALRRAPVEGAEQDGGARQPSSLEWTLFSALLIYWLHALTGWVHLGVTPVFWLLFGLLVSFRAGDRRARIRGEWAAPSVVGLLLVSSWLSYDAAVRWGFEARIARGKSGLSAAPELPLPVFEYELPLPIRHDPWFPRAIGELHVGRFVSQRQVGDLARARHWLERAAVLNPTNPFVLLGRLRVEQLALSVQPDGADRARARDLEKQLLEIDPSNPKVVWGVAGFRIQDGRYGAARQLYLEANEPIRLGARDQFAFAGMFRHSGDCIAAIEPYRAATVRTFGDQPDLWLDARLSLTDCLISLDRESEATLELLKIVKAFPNGPRIQRAARARLDRLWPS